MRGLASLYAILFWGGFALGQTSASRSLKINPSVDVTAVDYDYPAPTGLRSVRDVDFKNLKVLVFGYDGKPDGTIPLRHGSAEWERNDASLGGVYFFKGLNGIAEHALVDVGWISVGGSSTNTSYLIVFEVRGGRLHVTQQISYDAHAQWWTLDKFYPESGTLIVLGRTSDDSPHCCPRSLDEVMFEWKQDRFEITDAERLYVDSADTCGGTR